jgi:hypothetical protein
MIKSIVKITILIAITCFTTLVSKAQSGDNYAQFDVGAAGAYNSVKSDVQKALFRLLSPSIITKHRLLIIC